MIALYHYCCSHSRADIGKRGVLRPHYQPYLDRSLIWFTDLAEPDREGLGLTSTIIACDRTEFRYRVTDERTCLPFSAWWQAERIDPLVVSELTFPPKRPKHWYVSEVPVPVVLA